MIVIEKKTDTLHTILNIIYFNRVFIDLFCILLSKRKESKSYIKIQLISYHSGKFDKGIYLFSIDGRPVALEIDLNRNLLLDAFFVLFNYYDVLYYLDIVQFISWNVESWNVESFEKVEKLELCI